MNLRPPGYEPGELPDCSTPQKSFHVKKALGAAPLLGWRIITVSPINALTRQVLCLHIFSAITATIGYKNKHITTIRIAVTKTKNRNEAAAPAGRILTTRQAAEAWGVSRHAIFRLVKQKRLRPLVGLKEWRFAEGDFAKALERL